MRYHHFGAGRYVLRLDPGEEVVSSIASFASERGIAAGLVLGIGSLDHVVLGFLDPEEKVYLKRTFDERMEVGNLTGNIGVEGDRPFVHLHASVSPRELLTYTGHVHEARVGVVLETFVVAFPGKLRRAIDPKHGFLRWFFQGEASPEAGEASAP
jgi:predicted DNA-binding protein with PD1-like motif